MRSFNVQVSSEAEKDLIDIVLYLNGFAESVGAKYYDLIQRKILSLGSMPLRHPLVRDERLADKGVRWVFAKNYVIFYVVDKVKNIVDIKRVLHSLQEYDALL